jgi:hypothetical protein
MLAMYWIEMTEPTFDAKGYPTEETLAFIRNARVRFNELFKFIQKAWGNGYGWFHALPDKEGTHYRLVTGGWSGNEEIIGAMQENNIFWDLCWQSSKRGGEFLFFVHNHTL